MLEVDGSPLLHIGDATVGLGPIPGVGASLVWGKGVVESVSLDGDTLLVLSLEGITEETNGEVKSGREHTVLGLSTENGESIGLCEVLEEETVLHAH